MAQLKNPRDFVFESILPNFPGAPMDCIDVTAVTSAVAERDAAIESAIRTEPIPMRLHCPGCGELHIDEGAFATKVHHTHACQHCGMVWRPAIAPTVGVRFLPGFKDSV